MKKKMSIKKLTAVFVPIIAVLIVIGVVADALCGVYWSIIAAAFSDTSGVVDDDYKADAAANGEAVNVLLEEEGAVLMKNEDGVLPMTGDKKVNVYGKLSANMYLNGSGSSASNSALDTVSLKDAFESQGWEVNGQLWTFLETGGAGGSSSDIDEGGTTTRSDTEFTPEEYNAAVSWSSAKAFSEYAVVTFGRVGGEGSDLSRGEPGTDSDYLAFGSDELELLGKLSDEGFKVILLLNTSHVMELGEAEKYADAILWVGGPGVKGLTAVAEILTGAVSPSGRLVDTWMADPTTDSTYYTADTYTYVNQSGTKIGGYTDFNEGIYVGYKWYETAFYEGFWGDAEYGDIVVRPFGYGLTYGDFTESVSLAYDSLSRTFTFEVRVENLSSVPSKDVVELYVEKPYTEGGVEVPKVELVAYAKTGLLAAGVGGYDSAETLTLTVKADDLASYDETADLGNGAYVLAGGEYTFYVATGDTGAHIWADADDDHSCSYTLSRRVYSDSEDGARDSDGVAAKNVFGADYEENGHRNNTMAIDDDNAGFSALSRADGFANAYGTIFPDGDAPLFGTITLSSDDEIYDALVNRKADYVEYQGEILTDLSVGQKKKYTLADMYTTDADGNPLYTLEEDGSKTVTGRVSYDDPRWDYLISQMSVDDMEKLITIAGWKTMAVSSIEKETATDYDGPYGLSNLMKASTGQTQNCMSYCSEPVSASTWNTELLELLGKAVAREANASGQSGWYAPGMNIHRTPYGGRNPEYFSEDPYISGTMAAYETEGAVSGGLYCYLKHFAFNDIEANRTTKENCWMSEQTARETYLRPFEIAVKEGGATGIMTSYMWMCGQWMGSNYNLMTNVVRNEWGYVGAINTDNAGTASIDWMNPVQILTAGGDMVLEGIKVSLPSSFKNSDGGISAMKTASRHILYMTADAYLFREVEASAGNNMFVPLFVVANVLIYGAAIACAAVYGVKYARRRGEARDDAGGGADPSPDGGE